jgi:hypothetical protein
VARLAHLSHLRDWTIGITTSTALIAGSATGALPFSMTETLGFVTGAAAVWLLVRESIWNWPAGIANAVFYLVLFAQARFFADSAHSAGGGGVTAPPVGPAGRSRASGSSRPQPSRS